MPEALHKFPSTPHLTWLGQGVVRDDKVLSPGEAAEFLSGPIVVEEKVDGANLGISVDGRGHLRFQNRGNWLEGKLSGQWERLRGWAAEHGTPIREALPDRHILFGEWCYATHSINYEALPDWFLAFDVFDVNAGRFWGVERRNALAAAAKLSSIPIMSRGRFRIEDLVSLLSGPSLYARGPREGLYLRREHGDWLAARAKLVRPEFTQSLGEHWSNRQIRPNRLRPSAVNSLI